MSRYGFRWLGCVGRASRRLFHLIERSRRYRPRGRVRDPEEPADTTRQLEGRRTAAFHSSPHQISNRTSPQGRVASKLAEDRLPGDWQPRLKSLCLEAFPARPTPKSTLPTSCIALVHSTPPEKAFKHRTAAKLQLADAEFPTTIRDLIKTDGAAAWQSEVPEASLHLVVFRSQICPRQLHVSIRFFDGAHA